MWPQIILGGQFMQGLVDKSCRNSLPHQVEQLPHFLKALGALGKDGKTIGRACSCSH